MKRLLTIGAIITSSFLTTTGSINAASEPTVINSCSSTTIKSVGYRFEGEPTSGSGISLSNGLGSASVEQDLYKGFKAGDPVIVCLESIPEGCPPGDDRGKLFKVFNGRTNTMANLVKGYHMCGGA